jgi:hypothetical protein
VLTPEPLDSLAASHSSMFALSSSSPTCKARRCHYCAAPFMDVTLRGRNYGIDGYYSPWISGLVCSVSVSVVLLLLFPVFRSFLCFITVDSLVLREEPTLGFCSIHEKIRCVGENGLSR